MTWQNAEPDNRRSAAGGNEQKTHSVPLIEKLAWKLLTPHSRETVAETRLEAGVRGRVTVSRKPPLHRRANFGGQIVAHLVTNQSTRLAEARLLEGAAVAIAAARIKPDIVAGSINQIERNVKQRNVWYSWVALAEEVSYLKGYYDTDPPNVREQKKRLNDVYEVLKDCSDRLAAIDDLIDDLIISKLEAHAFQPRVYLPFQTLRKTLNAYHDAAKKAAKRMNAPKTGPEATKPAHIAIIVGRTLQQFHIKLNAAVGGEFVIAVGIVFDVLGIARADVRNNVRQALKAMQVTDNSIR